MSGVDTSRFLAICNGLQCLSGSKSLRRVIEDQAGQLMGVCIKYTYAPKSGQLKRRAAFQNRNAKAEGGKAKAYKTKGGKEWLSEDGQAALTHYLMNGSKRWNQFRWGRYQVLKAVMAAKQIDAQAAEGSRGAAKRTWYAIAEEIGPAAAERSKAPAWVKKTKRTFHGKTPPRMVSIQKQTTSSGYTIRISNFSRLLTGGGSAFSGKGKSRADLNGHAILQRAIATRSSAYSRELKTGVFNDIDQAKKRYPGLY